MEPWRLPSYSLHWLRAKHARVGVFKIAGCGYGQRLILNRIPIFLLRSILQPAWAADFKRICRDGRFDNFILWGSTMQHTCPGVSSFLRQL